MEVSNLSSVSVPAVDSNLQSSMAGKSGDSLSVGTVPNSMADT